MLLRVGVLPQLWGDATYSACWCCRRAAPRVISFAPGFVRSFLCQVRTARELFVPRSAAQKLDLVCHD